MLEFILGLIALMCVADRFCAQDMKLLEINQEENDARDVFF